MSNCILWFLSDGHKKNPNWQNPTILTLYLSDRHQAVVVDGHVSSVKPITAGVPQREQAWSFVIHHLYQWTASTASVERAEVFKCEPGCKSLGRVVRVERRHLWADFESEELENSLGRKARKSGSPRVRESGESGESGMAGRPWCRVDIH